MLRGTQVNSAWMADSAYQGDSYLLSENKLGDDRRWSGNVKGHMLIVE